MKTAPEQRPPYKPDNASLREAISLAQQGDGSAFELLYRLHCKRVYALCLRMVGVASEAEELTQEAFLQVFRKIHTFRGESAFSTWLHRLTANIVLMHFRKKRLISNPFEDTNTTDEETDGARNCHRFEPQYKSISASLVCGGTGGTVVATTDPVSLSASGDAEIESQISVPSTCFGPVVLVRAVFNGNAGPWIAGTGSNSTSEPNVKDGGDSN
jgi:RNA polymerase sigma factor (sigma-70 family)